MIYSNLKEFAALLPPKGRLLGLDVGEKRVGIALSDVTRTIATPYGVMLRQGKLKDIPALREIGKAQEIVGVVIGLPRHMDGSEGASCDMARQFARHLSKQWDIAVGFQDERLSTAAVTRVLVEADTTRKKRASVDDKLAAGYILQTALDTLRG